MHKIKKVAGKSYKFVSYPETVLFYLTVNVKNELLFDNPKQLR